MEQQLFRQLAYHRVAFDTNTNDVISGINIGVNAQDGAILRYSEIAGEFLKERYNGSVPFSMPKINIYKKDISAAGRFVYGTDFDWWSLSWYDWCKIEIDPSYTEESTIIHEFGHYVNYKMFGGHFDEMSGTSSQMKEGWAIFYSSAGINYANKVYGDYQSSYYDNTEQAPFNSTKFSGLSYSSSNPEYCAFGCYLWNIYDGYNDGDFKGVIYGNADNDDVSGYGLHVFDKMRSMAEKNTSDYNNSFKASLPSNLQTSIQKIYDNMFISSSTKMRPSQIENEYSEVVNSDYVIFEWSDNIYPNSSYSNHPDGIKLYKQTSVGDPWTYVGESSIGEEIFEYNTNSVSNYNYKLTSYNSSGDSYDEKIFNYSMNISMLGLTKLNEPDCGNYIVAASGGTGSYTYAWYVRYDGGIWSYKSSSSSYSFCPNYLYSSAEIRVDVTSGTQTKSASRFILLLNDGGIHPLMANQIDTISYNASTQSLNIENSYFNIDKTESIEIYPNPTKYNTLNVRTVNRSDIDKIVIFNTNGAVVYCDEYNNTYEANLNLSLLSKGIYIIKVYIDENIINRKFLIQ